MTPHPVATTLTLCERAIVEERTRNVSLICMFTTLNFPSFPSPPRSLTLYAVLTDGVGKGTLDILVTRLESDERLFFQQRPIEIPDRLHEFRVLFRFDTFRFPREGTYLFTLLVDGEWVAHRSLRVSQQEPSR